MAEQRNCGSCKECCISMSVSEVGKGPYTPCKYLNENGCSIHDQERCNTCEAFRCMWLKGELLENDRPDKIGAIFSVPRHNPAMLIPFKEMLGFVPHCILIVNETIKGALKTDRIVAIINRYRYKGYGILCGTQYGSQFLYKNIVSISTWVDGDVWPGISKVPPQKQQQPNALCDCGSNRKYKKCCGKV